MKRPLILLTLLLPIYFFESDQFHKKIYLAIEEGKESIEFEGKIYGWVVNHTKVRAYVKGSKADPDTPKGENPRARTENPRARTENPRANMGGYWSDLSEEEEEEKGRQFTSAYCANRKSKKCANLRARFYIPEDPIPVTISGGATATTPTVATIPPVADPCESDACYTWGSFRSQVTQPLIDQMEANDALGLFPDDELPESLFNKETFEQWQEAINLPLDNQALSSATAATLSLKLITAALSQVRLSRVEGLRAEGVSWHTWLSLPGFAVLILYLCISTWQIKGYWQRKMLQTEEQKAARMFEHLSRFQQAQRLDPSHNRPQNVSINMPTIPRSITGGY